MTNTETANTRNTVPKTRQQWYRFYSSHKRDDLIRLCQESNITIGLTGMRYTRKSVLIDLLMEKKKKARQSTSGGGGGGGSDSGGNGSRGVDDNQSLFETSENTIREEGRRNGGGDGKISRRKTSLRKQRPGLRLSYPSKFQGSVSMKQGPRDYMEDTYVVSKYDDMTLYGVFDGHGGDYVSKLLPKLMSERLMKGLPPSIRYQTPKLKNHIIKTCLEIDQSLSKNQEAMEAGSTASMVLHIPPLAYLINIGDSRSLLARKKPNGSLVVQCKTTDHKPDLVKEHQRIVQCGGRVTRETDDDARVDGVLAMSRAFGDHELKYNNSETSFGPVSSQPDISVVKLEPDSKYVAVLASDGLWDVVDNDKALKYVQHFGFDQAATPLTRYALENDSMDNVTTLVAAI